MLGMAANGLPRLNPATICCTDPILPSWYPVETVPPAAGPNERERMERVAGPTPMEASAPPVPVPELMLKLKMRQMRTTSSFCLLQRAELEIDQVSPKASMLEPKCRVHDGLAKLGAPEQSSTAL